MNDIMSSVAFQEFLQKRCEEIIEGDEEYRGINELILQKEGKIKTLVSGELLIKINEYEKLNLDLIAHAIFLIYRQAIDDFSPK
jgi:hypothetical protein